jgi:hypothetical protein
MIEEKDLSYKSNKDMIQALQSRLIEMEPELAASRDKVAQFERNASAQVSFNCYYAALHVDWARSDWRVRKHNQFNVVIFLL